MCCGRAGVVGVLGVVLPTSDRRPPAPNLQSRVLVRRQGTSREADCGYCGRCSRQTGYTFTDLSPSGNVVPLNTRLGFSSLDTTTVLVPNLPWPVRSRGMRVLDDPKIEGPALRGRPEHLSRPLAAAAARHAVLLDGERSCYVVYRRGTQALADFASVLHVSNPELFRPARAVLPAPAAAAPSPRDTGRSGVVGHQPPSRSRCRSPTKMFRSDRLRPDQIDYLYSELTCVAW